MFLSFLAFTWAKAIVDALLTALGTRPAAAILTTPHLDLFTNNITPTSADTFSTYTLPTFTGYASQALTTAGPVNTGPNTQAVVGNVLFECTGTAGGTATCYGVVMSDGASNFQGAWKFPQPVLFVNPGDFLSLSAALPAAESLLVNF